MRAVVETILKYCLPRNLSEYSLTGKSLQEKLEIRWVTLVCVFVSLIHLEPIMTNSNLTDTDSIK